MPDDLNWILTIVIGVFLPPILAYADRKNWSGTGRTLLAWGIAAVVAVIWAAVTGKLGLNRPTLETIGIVIAVTETSYNVLWKKVGAAADNGQIHAIIGYLFAKLTKMPTPPR